MPQNDWPVIPPERGDDLHNLEAAETADLVLFMAGNQFMAMAEIVAAFRQTHPEIGPIFYETLPPGMELKQILAGGAVFQDRLLRAAPDIYSAVSEKAMQQLSDVGLIAPGDYPLYLHNRLSLMVPAGNPAGITAVNDLERPEIRVSQPDPANEDIAYHILDMYRQAGGERLVHRIMEEKRTAGTTLMTVVHHRETPTRITDGTANVGPVWATEIHHARSLGLPIDEVAPGETLDQRDRINYYICRLKSAPHPENAQKFLEFILSSAAQAIYARYGFIPHRS
ncbi:MAG: substrate-binding domain-containing protein [Desulfobacterales bacterium]|jgi:ABC-type molybdate transport system substrate-binding protein